MLTYRVKFVSPCVVIMILILAACARPVPIPGVGDPQTPTIAAVEPGGPANALENTEWMLISYGPPGAETPVIESSGLSLQFEAENRAGGYAGCNSYGGSYRVDGDSLSFSDIFRTLMACQDQAIMQQEDRYLEALETTGEFDIDGDRLAIVYGDGQGVLNFVRPAAVAAIPTQTQAEAGLTPTTSGRSPAPAKSVEASPTGAAAEPYPYLDDRSAPAALVHSYFNAINHKEYARAYSYWRDPAGALGPFDQFQAGYEDTVAVDLTLGQVGGDAGAGQLYYSVPALLEARTTAGETQTYAACYILHLSQPAAQVVAPFAPLGIERGVARPVSGQADASAALAEACTGPDFPPSNPVDPPPTTEPDDIRAENYLDDRSGPVEVLRSYFNAINRKEFLRAYSYWETTGAGSQVGSFEQFERGFANTESVELTAGDVTGDAGAGQLYYSVPVILKAHTTDGITQTFAGCYILHLANPAAQVEPPFRPLAIRSAEIEQVSNDAGSLDLLNRTCTP